MARRQAEARGAWVSVEQAARLAAASAATVRGWVRQGSVRSEVSGGQTMLSLEDVVARALARGRTPDGGALQAQAEAALGQLETAARELAKAKTELAEVEGYTTLRQSLYIQPNARRGRAALEVDVER